MGIKSAGILLKRVVHGTIIVLALQSPNISRAAACRQTGQDESRCPAPEKGAPNVITRKQILAFSPRARATLVDAILAHWSGSASKGLNTPLRAQHFMAEIATETGGFTSLTENLNYSASGLLQTFPKRVSAAQAAALAGRPYDIAQAVYGGEWGRKNLGNRLGTTDFWDYRGSGFLQLTGRTNYVSRGEKLKLALADHPDDVRTPDLGFTTAVSFWSAVGAAQVADKDNLLAVRKIVNGGVNGMDIAQIWLARAKKFFPAPGVPLPAGGFDPVEANAVTARIGQTGIAIPAAPVADPTTFRSILAAFQKSNGLNPNGNFDEDTLYRLTDPSSIPQDE